MPLHEAESRSQELHPGFLFKVAEAQTFGPSDATFQGTLEGNWFGSEKPSIQLALREDAGVRSMTGFATMLAPCFPLCTVKSGLGKILV